LTQDFKKLNPILESVHAKSAGDVAKEAANGAQGAMSSQTGDEVPVRVVRADRRIDVSDQSLIEWEKEKTLLSGFFAPAPYVPFGDVHLAWGPEGFYVFSLSDTYVDPNFLDYDGNFPESESFQLHFSIAAEGRRDHFAAFLVAKNNPSYPDGFEIKPELFRLEGGVPIQKLPSEGHVQRIEKSLPHMAVEAFLPAKWFGLDELKAGMCLKVNIALVSYFREFSMVWSGNPDIREISDPTVFRKIVLE
jgi:hypothetical protein